MTRRPLITRAVVTSLEALTITTPATDDTEAGLHYLRALCRYESHPDVIAKRAKAAVTTRTINLRTRVIGLRRGRPPRITKGE